MASYLYFLTIFVLPIVNDCYKNCYSSNLVSRHAFVSFPKVMPFDRNMQMEESVLFSLKPNVMLIDYHI